MCKLMEDFRNEIIEDFRNDIKDEVAREVAIETTIETARQFGISEEAILGKVMGKYNLSESEAKSYMLKKSA